MSIGVILVAFVSAAAGLFLIAWFVERLSGKERGEKLLTTRKVVVTGMFSAVSALLMLAEVPVFFAPGFYKIDLSELPALICGFAYGPVAGVMTEFIKILLKLLFKGTSTALVGELANFVVGCFMVLPASAIYCFGKTRARAVISCIAGIISMTVAGSAMNAFFLLPAFAKMFEMPLDVIIGMGSELNHHITGLTSFVFWAVAPLNLLKGTVVSIITLIVYKKLSPVMKKHAG